MRHVYLDWNATTPPHPDVLEAMRAAAAVAWANPASVHGPGRRARAFVEDARESVAALVGMDPRDVVLTSGGTEANNLALALPFAAPRTDAGRDPRADAGKDPRANAGKDPRANAGKDLRADAGRDPRANAGKYPRADVGSEGRPAVVVSRIEHPSIVRMAEELARDGVRVEWIEPDASGVVPAAGFAAAVARLRADGADVRLLVLQAVNHETGVVQPVAEVAAIAHAGGALLHVDAVQAVGRLPASSWAGADMVSVAAHKIRGPKGVGALCTRPGLKVRPLFFGGAQERGVRPGTQDPVASAGFAEAAKRALATGPARHAEVASLRDRLEAALVALSAEVGLAPALANGSAPRAPHVTNLSWPGWRGDELCAALDLEGLAVSSGSACSAGTAEPSPVIRAMLGVPRATSAVRLSLGEDTTEDDVTRAVEAFRRVLTRVAPR